jgi:hypothetical protein
MCTAICCTGISVLIINITITIVIIIIIIILSSASLSASPMQQLGPPALGLRLLGFLGF